jgi:hypothetical protein
MKRPMLAIAGLTAWIVLSPAVAQEKKSGPEFTKEGELMRPADYREWIYLSSGLGMAYGPNAGAPNSDPPFDNVFVQRTAYKAFVETGKWPEGTMFALEVRKSASHQSINKAGHFQAGVSALEVEVKDSARFPDKWAFFDFSDDAVKAKPISGNSCIKCHSSNGASDNTFVQFYPTLLPIAKAKGTLTPAYIAAEQKAAAEQKTN